MKFFRVHTNDIAWLTRQPRGLFTTIGKLVDEKLLTEAEQKEYWKNRAYFERELPVPPFYEQGNPDRAVTWFKDTSAGKRVFREMVFYRRMADKYGKKLYISECGEIPGELIYEDEFQIAVKNCKGDAEITTNELTWPVRAVKESDIAQCVSVIRDSFLSVAEQFGITQKNAPRFTAFAINEGKLRTQLVDENRHMYGFFRGGRLTGYYSLQILPDHECELNNLCVLPDFRHQKIGGELLLDACSRASELGCVRMYIGIVEENRILREWYEHYGFTHNGTKKFDFFPFTCGYMEKKLTYTD